MHQVFWFKNSEFQFKTNKLEMRNFEILLLYHCAQRLSPKKKAVTFELKNTSDFILYGWQREAMERTFIHSRMFAMPCKALIQPILWLDPKRVTHCFALTAKWASTVQSQCRTLLMFSHPKSEASSFFRKRAKKGRLECPVADKKCLSSCLVFSVFFACLF